MQDVPDFANAQTTMRGLGFELTDQRYDEKTFGSWWIEATAGKLRVRVIWDGRDRWLIIQEPGQKEGFWWKDQWIAGRGRAAATDEFGGVLAAMIDQARKS